jgi:hypothetical protein
MFFRPTGQSVPKQEVDDLNELSKFEKELDSPDSSDADLALLDGLPVQNHNLLRKHLIVDDLDNFEEGYPAKNRRHGTSMASIMIHGDLNEENTKALSNPIYVRPILSFDQSQERERVPRDRLLVSILYDSVARMVDNVYTYGKPRAQNVKVINLSIGDEFRPFFNELSAVARLVDWLSHKYNVLFLISGGNHRDEINIDTDGNELDELSEEEIQTKTLLSIYRDQRNRRLISPAESINSITVGAAHHDGSEYNVGNTLYDLIYDSELPSPINPVGSGFRRSVKPDIIMPGGIVLYRMNSINENKAILKPVSYPRVPPGIKVAFPSSNEGDLDSVAYTSGTSNATAMTSNFAGKVIEVLRELNLETNRRIPEHYFPVIVKTLIGHTAGWGNKYEYLRDILGNEISSHKLKDGISRIIGFGSLSQNRAYECDINRASLLGFGELKKERGHIYELPLPPDLSAKVINKRVIITLAWFSPVNCFRKEYRMAHLYFDPPTDDLEIDREETHGMTVKRGTLQHEVLEGAKADPILDGQTMNIKISCREDAGILNDRIRYGLCVTLETPDTYDIPIYEQIKERISVPVEIRTES